MIATTQSLTSNSKKKNSKVKLFAPPEQPINSLNYSRKIIINNRTEIINGKNQSLVLFNNYLSCATNKINYFGGFEI